MAPDFMDDNDNPLIYSEDHTNEENLQVHQEDSQVEFHDKYDTSSDSGNEEEDDSLIFVTAYPVNTDRSTSMALSSNNVRKGDNDRRCSKRARESPSQLITLPT